MSGQAKWQLYPENPSLATKLGSHLGVSPLIAQLLLNRNIRSLAQAQRFLNPDPTQTENFPETLLQAATELILKTIQKNGRILLYGDYDVDGMTSTAIMMTTLEAAGAKVSYYIPHRFTEGYGLGEPFIRTLIANPVDLLITLDCGISNASELTLLKRHAPTSVIIFDHHTIPENTPPADVVLNPKALPDTSPLYGLCTAGIAYKFAEYFCESAKLDFDPNSLLDLAAIGTIADVAPLIGENRVITKTGLPLVLKNRRLGLSALLEAADYKGKRITTRDVGFTIAPRLNAAGRIAHAKMGVELLLCATHEDAANQAFQLQKLNEERQYLGQVLLQEATHAVETSQQDWPVLVLAGKNWHSGIIGITASQLCRKYQKPVVMISYTDDTARGSARSFGQINIYQLLKSCESYFDTFGGHKEAAGFSLQPAKIPAFQRALCESAATFITPNDLIQLLDIDAAITPDQLSLDHAKALRDLEPFGAGNAMPLFYCDQLKPLDYKVVGNGQHLKATFTDKTGKKVIDAIGFGLASKLTALQKPKVELAFGLEINEWQGTTLPQLQLVDIKS
ncbi:MAG: single-stranded-DNA-specific exonuclease RecJ [Candidatus Margulisiibacteriota bacterium]